MFYLIKKHAILLGIIALFGYSIVGTATRVGEIQKRAPQELEEKNFTVLRAEGYQYGSWMNHGGKVWYHVAEKATPNIRYRVYVTLWNDQLQYTYGAAEDINNLQVNLGNK